MVEKHKTGDALMLKKIIYTSALCAMLVAPAAYSQTMTATGVQGVDSSSGASLAAKVDELGRNIATIITQMSDMGDQISNLQSSIDTLNNTTIPGIENRLNDLDTRLTNVENSLSRLDGLETRITNIENNPGSIMANMEVTVVTQTLCKKASGTYTLTAHCPSGYRLLSCSGGAGDLDESYEGYDIRPVSQTTCQAIVKEPACYSSSSQTARTNLYAFCFKFAEN